MKRLIVLLALCFVPLLALAQVDVTAKGQGYFTVTVDGKDVSNHTAEREAIEAAINRKAASPGSAVGYRHDYPVTVVAPAGVKVDFSAQNQGYYIVSVDGKDVSQHTQEREASASAANQKLKNPSAKVEYRHAYVVSVAAIGGSVTPPPPPPPPPSPTTTSKTLYWDPVNNSRVNGYKVYYGTASGKYGAPISVGKVTTYDVTGLQQGTTYYFAVTTVYDGTSESVFSNEVFWP